MHAEARDGVFQQDMAAHSWSSMRLIAALASRGALMTTCSPLDSSSALNSPSGLPHATQHAQRAPLSPLCTKESHANCTLMPALSFTSFNKITHFLELNPNLLCICVPFPRLAIDNHQDTVCIVLEGLCCTRIQHLVHSWANRGHSINQIVWFSTTVISFVQCKRYDTSKILNLNVFIYLIIITDFIFS